MNNSKGNYWDILNRIPIDIDLMLRFIALFSRFEFALKKCGYLQNSRNAKPDWSRFARVIEEKFCVDHNNDTLRRACEYLHRNPPLKQIVKEGKLAWEPMSMNPTGTAERLIQAVCVTRNNFFHGGKFPYFPVQDPIRDESLIKSCVCILDYCLTLDDATNGAFWCVDVDS